MQYWDASSRAFVDMLDSFAHLPLLDDLALARPSALLEPERLSVLLHEYVHLLSIQGPISIFSAYQTSMSYALRELCLLKAQHDPKGLRFFTVNNDHFYRDVPAEDLAARIFLEQHSENLRSYVNFFNAYRWLFEGLALFVQWDYTPHPVLPPSSLVKLVDGLLRARQPEAEPSWQDILDSFYAVQESERQERRKWGLYRSSHPSNRDYFVGYLLVKHLWQLLAERDQRLRHPDMFFRFVLTFLLHDWGILTLCTPTMGTTIFEQEACIKERIQGLQMNALEQIARMDRASVVELTNRLVDHPGSLFGELFEILYSSSPEHESLFLVDSEEWERQISERVHRGLIWHFKALFPSTSMRDGLRNELEKIDGDAMSLFQLIRSHHTFFKLRASSCGLIGFQPLGSIFRTVFYFPEGRLSRIQDLSVEQAHTLLEELRKSGAKHIEFPWSGIDLSQVAGLDEKVLGKALSQFGVDRPPLMLDVYDLFEVAGSQWVHVRVAGDRIVLLALRSPSPSIDREKDIRKIAGHLDRSTYWERLTLPMGIFPSGGDYFYEYLNVDGWNASSSEFLSGILRGAWRALFTASGIDDKELDILWDRRIPGVIARTERALRLCETLCSKTRLGVASSDTETLNDVARMNDRWSARVGTPLINTVRSQDRPPELIWAY